MEVQESDTFQDLFKDEIERNVGKLFPLAQKCITFSTNETEVLRALKITFEFGFKVYSIEEVENGMLLLACPAARKLFFKQLENLEIDRKSQTLQDVAINCTHFFDVCSTILSYISQFFMQLSKLQKVNISHVESLLLHSAEILYGCFSHCNISQQIYGSNFSSVTKPLTSCFKKCCAILELLLNLLEYNIMCNFNDTREVELLCQTLKNLSKFGFILTNLDVKTMAKVWKVHVSLIEKYFLHLKENFKIGEVIKSLAKAISTSAETVLTGIDDDQDINRTIKLACFNLKLLIKFCEIFQTVTVDSENCVFNLLLTLCGCNFIPSDNEKIKTNVNNDLLKQLAFGTDPLLSHLLKNENIINEFSEMNKNLHQTSHKAISFLILCCLVLKKMIYSTNETRSLWLNENTNILNWIFNCVTCNQYTICSKSKISDGVSSGKQKRIICLYQYVLVTVSTYVLTSTSKEFHLVEKVLLENIVQPQPLSALLAIDIWCIIARFSEPDLCLTQIFKLGKIFNNFNYETVRVEKCYLMSLIQRLFPLLTNNQRQVFIKSFQLPFSSELWRIHRAHKGNEDFNLYIMYDLNNSFVCQIEKYFYKEDVFLQYFNESAYMKSEGNDNIINQKIFEKLAVQLWQFNSPAMSSFEYRSNYFKLACVVTVNALPYISSEAILMITCKIKKLLSDSFSGFEMYFIWILESLSTITLSPDKCQRTIIETIAEIYAILLSSKNILIKQRALENFYNFSHFTNHPEIISLSVNNSPALKEDVTNYFKKNIPAESCIDVHAYGSSLCEATQSHSCCFAANDPRETNINPSKGNAQDIFDRWKKDGKTLLQFINHLTSLQRKDIKNICTTLLDSCQ